MYEQKQANIFSGWVMLPVTLIMLFGGAILFISSAAAMDHSRFGAAAPMAGLGLLVGGISGVLGFFLLFGHFTLQPNQARVLLLFGEYKGTHTQNGFYWVNPFYSKRLVSQRLQNMEGAHLKVNDKQGNPIEIAAVVVWRVKNPAQAILDVENYEQFVKVQSETALRHLANSYSYDHGEEHEVTLRSGVDEVSAALQRELLERLRPAGVEVVEARLTHLAYAPEIASAMLRRQQAEAVIAARQKIVHGAVSMVQMALHELAEKQIVVLDEERKIAMVSNLLVVLCGETEVHPVVNTGTLYT